APATSRSRVRPARFAGQLRVATAGAAHRGLRGRRRGRPHRGAPVRSGRGPGDHRRAGRERRAVTVRSGLDLRRNPMHSTATATVAAPANRVWAVLSDYEGMSSWAPGLKITVARPGSPEPNGVGAQR